MADAGDEASLPSSSATLSAPALAKAVLAVANGVKLGRKPTLTHHHEREAIEITPTGLGLRWPKLDADHYLPALLDGVFGSPR